MHQPGVCSEKIERDVCVNIIREIIGILIRKIIGILK